MGYTVADVANRSTQINLIAHFEFRRASHLQEFRELPVDLGTNGAGAIFALVTGQPAWHYIVCIHLMRTDNWLYKPKL